MERAGPSKRSVPAVSLALLLTTRCRLLHRRVSRSFWRGRFGCISCYKLNRCYIKLSLVNILENVFVFIEILFKMLLFKGGVLLYAEQCICVCMYIYIYIYIYIYVCIYTHKHTHTHTHTHTYIYIYILFLSWQS